MHIYIFFNFSWGKYSVAVLFPAGVLSPIMAMGRVMSRRKKKKKSFSRVILFVGTVILLPVQIDPPIAFKTVYKTADFINWHWVISKLSTVSLYIMHFWPPRGLQYSLLLFNPETHYFSANQIKSNLIMYSGFTYSQQIMISLWFFFDYTWLEKLYLGKNHRCQATQKAEVL